MIDTRLQVSQHNIARERLLSLLPLLLMSELREESLGCDSKLTHSLILYHGREERDCIELLHDGTRVDNAIGVQVISRLRSSSHDSLVQHPEVALLDDDVGKSDVASSHKTGAQVDMAAISHLPLGTREAVVTRRVLRHEVMRLLCMCSSARVSG